PRTLRPSLRPFTAPASTSLSTSTSASPKRSRSPTLISAYSTRNGFVNPRLGMRRWIGIWPPSNPMKFMLPVRAFWPLPPRPAVLPSPLAWPRPTRFFSFTPPPAGGVNLVSSFISITSSSAPRRRGGRGEKILFLNQKPPRSPRLRGALEALSGLLRLRALLHQLPAAQG